MKTTSKMIILNLMITCIATLLVSCATKKTSSTPLGSGSEKKVELGYDSLSSEMLMIDEAPVKRSSPPLYYPERAAKEKLEGSVWVKVLIDWNGEVRAVEVSKHSGLHVGFEGAAIENAKKTKWKPAMQDGRPVAIWVTYEIKFQMRD